MSGDNATHPISAGWPEHRRITVVRIGHFRVDRVWLRAKQPTGGRDWVDYDVVFEVDTAGEFGLGSVSARRTLSSSDLRRDALYLAWLWRVAHSPPPESRPKSVPYYRRRVWAVDFEVEGTPPEEWYEDAFFRRPDQPTIDVDEGAALVEGALHELEEPETA